MKILIDTREQRPLFTKYDDVNAVRDTLPAGDYTIVGHDQPGDDNSIIIERKKDCQELIQNLGSGWDRFTREMEILNQYKYKQIVVCGHNNFEYLIKQGFTRLGANFIYSRIADLYLYYQVPIIFVGDAQSAEKHIYRLFLNILRKTSNEN